MISADSRSDSELIDLCNRGSRQEAESAFNSLYLRHKDYVLRVAHRFTADTDIALDVLQDTFIYLLRKFPPPGDGLVLTANLRSLLYVAAKNTALTRLRSSFASRRDDSIDPDEMAIEQREESELDRLLPGLSPREREIVTLRFIDDLSLSDIAEALEIPLGTVKSRMNHAIRSLRKSPYVKDFFEK